MPTTWHIQTSIAKIPCELFMRYCKCTPFFFHYLVRYLRHNQYVGSLTHARKRWCTNYHRPRVKIFTSVFSLFGYYFEPILFYFYCFVMVKSPKSDSFDYFYSNIWANSFISPKCWTFTPYTSLGHSSWNSYSWLLHPNYVDETTSKVTSDEFLLNEIVFIQFFPSNAIKGEKGFKKFAIFLWFILLQIENIKCVYEVSQKEKINEKSLNVTKWYRKQSHRLSILLNSSWNAFSRFGWVPIAFDSMSWVLV